MDFFKLNRTWKKWTLAFILAYSLAVLVEGLLYGSSVASKSGGQVYWTTVWMYLTIEAWEYWGAMAMLPYFLLEVTAFVSAMMISSIYDGSEAVRAYTIVAMTLNLGGLIIFYAVLRKSKAS